MRVSEPTMSSLMRGSDLHHQLSRERVARDASRASRGSGGRHMRKSAIAALLGAFAMRIVVGAIVPAAADGHHGGDWHGWHGRAWHGGFPGRGHHWRGYPYFYGPPVFFFPPP